MMVLFIEAQFMQELGINANYNMKRERLISSEVELNTDCLDTLIDDIEENVNRGVDMCNSLFGTNIKFSVRRYGEQETDAVVTTQQTDDKQQDTDTGKGGDNDA